MEMLIADHSTPAAARLIKSNEKASISKRRKFSLNLNVTPTSGPRPDPATHKVAKKYSSKVYKTRSVNTSRADVMYEDEAKADPDYTKVKSCRARLFMAAAKPMSDSTRVQRLFFNLGQNLYLDKQPDKTEVGEGSLRLSLWKSNAIDKFQRVGARFSITLNFDAIQQIKAHADDINLSLSLTDNENFIGFCLTLGQMLFLTIEPDICMVNLRKWYKPVANRNIPEAELRPSKEGVLLSYEQFKRFDEFLNTQLSTEFTTFDSHIFCCEREDHDDAKCGMCTMQGLLPIQRDFRRLLDEW